MLGVVYKLFSEWVACGCQFKARIKLRSFNTVLHYMSPLIVFEKL